MFTATKKQQHYLKQLAALQFPGSIDNLSTRMPIYALEQQLPKDDTMKLDDAVIEGQDIEYSKFYDEDGCSYSSVSELVEVQLGLDDDDSIRNTTRKTQTCRTSRTKSCGKWIRRIFRNCCCLSLMKPTM